MSAQFRAFVDAIILKAHVACGNAPDHVVAGMAEAGIPTAVTPEEIKFMQDVKRKYLAGRLHKFEQMYVERIPLWDFYSTDIDAPDQDMADAESPLRALIRYKDSTGAFPLPPLV